MQDTAQHSTETTPNPQFIHLRCHSEYSIVDGIVRIDDYISAANKDAMPAVALTDLSNLFGAIKFYKAARDKGIKPVLGCELWLENTKNRDQAFRLLLLVQNNAGYLKLCQLISRAYLENQYRGRAEIKQAWLEGQDNQATEGLLLISGNKNSDIGTALQANNHAAAGVLAKTWSALFPHRFYIELQRTSINNPAQEALINNALNLASQCDLPVVATHPIQFTTPDDFTAHEARLASPRAICWLIRAAQKTLRLSNILKRRRKCASYLRIFPKRSPTR